VPGWRDPPPRAPGSAAPRFHGLGLSRRRRGVWWVAELRCSGWVSEAHRATIPSALQAVGTCWVLLEDVRPVGQAQRLLMLDLTCFPGNPEDCWPSIESLALRCHSGYLPLSRHRREDPGLPGEGASGRQGSFSSGSPLLRRPGAVGSGNCIRVCKADMNEVNVYVTQPVPRVVGRPQLSSTRQCTAVFLPHDCQAADGRAPR
jgi:hypothetical protein